MALSQPCPNAAAGLGEHWNHILKPELKCQITGNTKALRDSTIFQDIVYMLNYKHLYCTVSPVKRGKVIVTPWRQKECVWSSGDLWG